MINKVKKFIVVYLMYGYKKQNYCILVLWIVFIS